jgi:hypothetical protein
VGTSRSKRPPKLVLCVIDAMAPEMLERAIGEGVAPMLAQLVERGRYIPDCVAAFPSVTPVCAASIVTGTAQDQHLIPAMNWYHRGERRYVEYGSSFRAAQRFGIARQLTDTVYNMNRAHLSEEVETVFEALDDEGVRTAGTTYLMYRGRHRHEPQRDSPLTRVVSALIASRATWWSTICSTSCCCRCPTTTGTRTSAGPSRRCSRSRRPICNWRG